MFNIDIIKDCLNEHSVSFVFLALAVCLFLKLIKRQKNLPPGPVGLPLIGALWEIKNGAKLHLDFCRLGQQYGDVFSIYVGGQLIVVLNSHDAIKEAFVTRGADFAGRPVDPMSAKATGFNDQIFNATYNDTWKENKKFAVQALRASGFGTRASESKVMNGINAMVKHLEEKDGKPFVLAHSDFDKMTTQIIINIIFGKNYSWDDPELLDFIEVSSQFSELFNEMLTVDFVSTFLPEWVVRRIFSKRIKRASDEVNKEKRLIMKYVQENRSTFDKSNLRDVVDIYINAQEDRGFDDSIFASTILTFLPDSINTMGVLLHWVLFYLTLKPEVQLKAQEQIREVVGSSRQICLSDKSSLPYIEAIIIETARIANSAPLSAPHTAIRDCVFRGYNIPRKNCLIFANLFAVHKDPGLFPDPETFNPSRFIDSDGLLLKNDSVIPFSMGRRMCLGEQMVKVEIFLFVSNLLQQFTFKLPEDDPIPAQDDVVAQFFSAHNPFRVCAVPRS